MPSGAKRRKAAKKKKEKQPHVVQPSTDSNNSQHLSGADEVRSQDERDSDGVETGSPVSKDQNPFKNENEHAEKKEEGSVQSMDGENNSVVEVGSEDSQERRLKEEASVQSIHGENKSVVEVGSQDSQERRRGDGEEVEVIGVMESKAGRWADESEDGEKKEEASIQSMDGDIRSVEEVHPQDSQERRQADGEVVEVTDIMEPKAGRRADENDDAEKNEEAYVQSLDRENKSVEEVGSLDSQERRQADGEVTEVIGIMESKEGFPSKDLGFEHDKAAELYDGSARFNGDEPQVAEKKLEEEHIAAVSVLEITLSDDSVKTDSISKVLTDITEEYIGQSQVAEKLTEEENGAAISVLETAPSDGLVKSIDTISKEVTGATEEVMGESLVAEKKPGDENGAVISVLETALSDASVKSIDSISKKVTGVTEEHIDESQGAKKISEEETVGANSISETAQSDGNVKSINSISNEVTVVTEKATTGEANDTVLVTSPIVERVDSSSKEVAGVQESATVEDPSVSCSNESNSNDTRDNTLSNINEVSGDSSALKTEDKVFPLSDANIQALSSKVVSEKENETPLSSTAPQADKGEDNGKETDIPECSKNQPFVSSVPPQTVAKTYWLGCCGLFDAFLGASR